MKQRSNRTLGLIFKDLLEGVHQLATSEVQLMQVELRRSAQLTQRRSKYLIFSVSLAVLGLIPFIAFLVLGLGEILGGRYALSSLIVSVVCCGVGSFFAARLSRNFPVQSLSLPLTRRSIQTEAGRLFQLPREQEKKAS